MPTRRPRCPGRRIDFDAELAAWFDHWLRGDGPHEDRCDVFVRTSTRPEVDLDLHEGWWVTLPTVPPVTEATLDLTAPVSLERGPRRRDGRLDRLRRPSALGPVGGPAARRRALVDLGDRPTAGSGRRPSGAAGEALGDRRPPASLSVKICDVFPDGTSALVTRGTLDLAYRDGVHGTPSPLVPGREYEVEVVLDACAYQWTPGQTLRVSVAGADWPNTVAPPEPVTITLRTAVADAAAAGRAGLPAPRSSSRERSTPRSRPRASAGRSTTTSCTGRRRRRRGRTAAYATPYDGTAHELYLGEVSVDTRTFAQSADAHTVFDLTWPGIEVDGALGHDARRHARRPTTCRSGCRRSTTARRSVTGPGRSRSPAEGAVARLRGKAGHAPMLMRRWTP